MTALLKCHRLARLSTFGEQFMSSKRQRRVGEMRTKKKKRGRKALLLVLIGATVLGFLIFFFISVFNSVYPPVGGKETVAKKREKIAVTAYFSDANERFLVAEKRWVPKSGTMPSGPARCTPCRGTSEPSMLQVAGQSARKSSSNRNSPSAAHLRPSSCARRRRVCPAPPRPSRLPSPA